MVLFFHMTMAMIMVSRLYYGYLCNTKQLVSVLRRLAVSL